MLHKKKRPTIGNHVAGHFRPQTPFGYPTRNFIVSISSIIIFSRGSPIAHPRLRDVLGAHATMMASGRKSSPVPHCAFHAKGRRRGSRHNGDKWAQRAAPPRSAYSRLRDVVVANATMMTSERKSSPVPQCVFQAKGRRRG